MVELTAVVVAAWEEEGMAAVVRVAVKLGEEAKGAEATAKVVTALAMAAVAVSEARATGAREVGAGNAVAVVTVAEARAEAAVEAAVTVGVAPVEAASAVAGSAVAAKGAPEIVAEAQMVATRSTKSTTAALRCGPCPRWCASSTRPLEATTQDESTGEGIRRTSLHLGTSGTPRPAAWPTPCTQHAWG